MGAIVKQYHRGLLLLFDLTTLRGKPSVPMPLQLDVLPQHGPKALGPSYHAGKRDSKEACSADVL